MNNERPFHVEALDEALEEARSRVDQYASELDRHRKRHADVFDTDEELRDALRRAERDRVGTEDAIRSQGYGVIPRSSKVVTS